MTIQTHKKKGTHNWRLLLLLPLFLVSFVSARADDYGIEEIRKLVYQDTDLALERLDSLRKRCEKGNWKECSQSEIEFNYALINRNKDRIWTSQKHALNAYNLGKRPQDSEWMLEALRILCETYQENHNWMQMGKYAKIMESEGEQLNNYLGDWYVAHAQIMKIITESVSSHDEDAIQQLQDVSKRLDSYDKNKYFTGNMMLQYAIYQGQITLYRDWGEYDKAEKVIDKFLTEMEKNRNNPLNQRTHDDYLLTRYQLLIDKATVMHLQGKNGDEYIDEALQLNQKFPDVPLVYKEVGDYLYETHRYDDFARIIGGELNKRYGNVASPHARRKCSCCATPSSSRRKARAPRAKPGPTAPSRCTPTS